MNPHAKRLEDADRERANVKIRCWVRLPTTSPPRLHFGVSRRRLALANVRSFAFTRFVNSIARSRNISSVLLIFFFRGRFCFAFVPSGLPNHTPMLQAYRSAIEHPSVVHCHRPGTDCFPKRAGVLVQTQRC